MAANLTPHLSPCSASDIVATLRTNRSAALVQWKLHYEQSSSPGLAARSIDFRTRVHRTHRLSGSYQHQQHLMGTVPVRAVMIPPWAASTLSTISKSTTLRIVTCHRQRSNAGLGLGKAGTQASVLGGKVFETESRLSADVESFQRRRICQGAPIDYCVIIKDTRLAHDDRMSRQPGRLLLHCL